MHLENRSWEISTESSCDHRLYLAKDWILECIFCTLNFYVLCHDFLNQNFLVVNPSASPLRFASIFKGFNFRLHLLHAKACLCHTPVP